MSSPRRSARAPRRPAGFTLVELMIGMVIGLVATLAVTHVLVNSEGQKRTTTSGSDALVNGALALNTLQRTIQSAGYGFAATPSIIGCPLAANYNGAPVGMPANLVPVTITPGVVSDRIRVFSSGKKTFSAPLRIVVPGYAVGDTLFPLSAVRGVEEGDLIIAASTATTACEMFRVTSIASGTQVGRENNQWNAASFPANAYKDGAFAINMGAPLDVTYSIVSGSLRSSSLNIDNGTGQPSYDAAPVELFPHVIRMQAFYGKDTDADGSVDKWDKVAPTTNAEWRQLIAVRVAVVARSSQYEKDNVSFDDPLWDVGTAVAVPGSAACGTSKCIKMVVRTEEDGSAVADWQHYRYRVFDTVVPLRNMLWNS